MSIHQHTQCNTTSGGLVLPCESRDISERPSAQVKHNRTGLEWKYSSEEAIKNNEWTVLTTNNMQAEVKQTAGDDKIK